MKELNRAIADREPTYLHMVLQPTGEAGQSSSPPAPRGEGECRCEGYDTTTPRPPSRVDWGLTHSPLSFFCLKTCKWFQGEEKGVQIITGVKLPMCRSKLVLRCQCANQSWCSPVFLCFFFVWRVRCRVNLVHTSLIIGIMGNYIASQLYCIDHSLTGGKVPVCRS